MDESLIHHAKSEAARRGKSVSQMVGEFFDALGASSTELPEHPPITSSLVGLLNDARISEEDYKKHLKEKHL